MNNHLQRRSLRLRNYNYANAGAYFVTICTHQRRCLLGEIENGTMHLNERGKLAQACWSAIPRQFAQVVLDEFVIMPNHIHGILMLTGVMNHAPTYHAI